MASQAFSRIAPIHPSFTRALPDFRSEVHLLIIQRNELLRRSLVRYLRPYYAEVHHAGTALEADQVLGTSDAYFHLVCGQVLGPAESDGATRIAQWRAEFSSILRAVLATGAEEVPELNPAVDAVFRKPSEPQALIALLQIPALTDHLTLN